MLDRNDVIQYLRSMSQEEIAQLLQAADVIPPDSASNGITIELIPCPYCGGHNIIRYGHKHGKQRFFCKDCNKTYVPTTNTIMSMSHFGREVWEELLLQTLEGNSLSHAKKTLGLTHVTAFNMRHKILLALADKYKESPVILGDVSEFDETFVLDCYKGKQLPAEILRPKRLHGAKAQKRGISNEYICICTGVQRKGNALVKTENRAKPSCKELQEVFEGHIEAGTLALTDGLKSYSVLEAVADCTVEDVNTQPSRFYNLNTVNNLHSFIKQRYNFYRGVATKYINRYNALFQAAYRWTRDQMNELCKKLFTTGSTTVYTIKDIKKLNLLAI